MVPLPLTEKFWESCITKPRNVRGSVGAAILTDPAVGLMYVALASTDTATRLFLAGECERVSAIARTRAAAFSVVARSFRVQDGRAMPPGGDAALPLWRRLGLPSDRSVGLPDAPRLRRRRSPRVLLRHDRAARARAAAVCAGPLRARRRRHGNWRGDLPRLLPSSDPSWSIVDRPFARMTVDVAFVLQQVRLTPDGRLAGPATDAFLSALFADGDVDRGVDDPAALLRRTARLDAASLVRLVMVPDWTRRRARLMTRVVRATRVCGTAAGRRVGRADGAAWRVQGRDAAVCARADRRALASRHRGGRSPEPAVRAAGWQGSRRCPSIGSAPRSAASRLRSR